MRCLVALALLAAGGCSGDSGSDRGSVPQGGSAAAGTGAGAATAGAAGGTAGMAGTVTAGSSGASAGNSGPGDPPTGGSGGPITEQECASETFIAEQTPLDMFVMLDASASMSAPYWTSGTPSAGDCNLGDPLDSRWCLMINAFSKFLKDPASAGTRVALQFYNSQIAPYATCKTGGGLGMPLIPLTELPDAAGTFDSILNTAVPVSGTPTEAAIRGIVQYTGANQTPGREMVGVLLTDGQPDGKAAGCEVNGAPLGAILEDHRTATGIRTFGIGVTGASFEILETIAMGGGAEPHSDYCSPEPGADGMVADTCHYYDVGDGSGDALVEALRAISLDAIGCSVPLPEASGPAAVDPGKVNVTFTAGDGTLHEMLKVKTAGECLDWTWHYDDDKAPTTIELCPQACDVVSTDGMGQLDIVVGCETQVPD